jgi:hypothetical protein
MTAQRSLVNATVVALLVAACGQATATSSVTTSARTTPGTTRPETTAPEHSRSGRGWIGGEPDWIARNDVYAAADTVGVAEAAAEPLAVSATASSASGEASDSGSSERIAAAGLRAGSVDDNADYAAYLEYSARLNTEGIVTRPFDPAGRIVVTVIGSNDLPVAGVPVIVSADDRQVAELRTTANGTARFLPGLYAAADTATFTFRAGTAVASAAAGETVGLTLDTPGGVQGPVAVDVLFLLDATGSMGDEIGQLKMTIDQVASDVAALAGEPDVRFAFTLYRDEGDVFVTKSYDFTGNVDEFRTALAAVVADGGGDYPEALEEGLAEALTGPAWRDPATTLQLMFLVADAPPRLDRQVPVDYPASIRDAVTRGIKIFPIASSESDDHAEMVFRQLAVATGARFVFLSYGAAGAAIGASSDIGPPDYEEMSLDVLVVRFIAEELSALTGNDVPIPTTVSPPVTNPPGQ